MLSARGRTTTVNGQSKAFGFKAPAGVDLIEEPLGFAFEFRAKRLQGIRRFDSRVIDRLLHKGERNGDAVLDDGMDMVVFQPGVEGGGVTEQPIGDDNARPLAGA